MDSISRSYPIGSLLLLAKGPDLELGSTPVDAEFNQGSNFRSDKMDDELYVLDGQQRITSIARVFLNADPKNSYYFDLKEMSDKYDRYDPSWILKSRHVGHAPETKKKGRYLRADIVLDQTRADFYLPVYFEDSGDFPEFKEDRNAGRRVIAKIKSVFEAIRKYRVPVIVVERDSGVDSICRIFETVNNTGIKLTTFDLAIARFYSKGVNLREMWLSTQKKHKLLKDFDVDGERILQTLHIVVAVRDKDGKYIEPTRSNLLDLDSDKINREWESVSEALAKTYQWAQGQGARPKLENAKSTLPSHNILVSLAAIRNLKLRDGHADHPWRDPDFICRWYFSKVMQGGASQASNYWISQDFQALREYVEGGKPPTCLQVNLNTEILLSLKPADVRYKTLQNILAKTIHQDLFTGEIINSESILHDHHIFPSARKKDGLNQFTLDSICNRLPVLATSNWKSSDEDPNSYFKKMADSARTHGRLDGLTARMQNCLIPGDPKQAQWADSFSITRFEEFCRERAELIISRVRQIVGDSLQVNASSNNELMDDDDY